jgi:hypothetical protein
VLLGRLTSARRSWLLLLAIALAACAAVVASADGFGPDSDPSPARAAFLSPVSPGRHPLVIDVSRAAIGRPIPPGFVGLSLEYTTIPRYAGGNPLAIDPVFVQLIRALAPGQRPVLRLGGDTTDWTWWPVRHMVKPAGIRIAIGPRFGALLHGLATATDARLILGIDLEANSLRIASVEATRLVRAVGRNWVQALELGNEPELYGSWPWRVTPTGRPIIGRPADYGVSAYIKNFRSIAAGLPPISLAGPALGGPKWISHVRQFIDAESRLGLVTVHTYPLQKCDTPLVAPTYPTLSNLLAARASRGLAARLADAVRTAHGEGLPLRVDEINSVACGGAVGVSNTFASALWALDTMFALARTGVDGVNIHTFQIGKYRLFGTRFDHGRWQAAVAPEYYGLLLFAQAAPPRARLLRLAIRGTSLRAWATRATDGTIRVVLINDSAAASRVVELRGSLGSHPAAYEALVAPGLGATRRISLGQASFGVSTETGSLASPRRILLAPRHGVYVVRVPAASAVMLTVPGHVS